MIDMAQSELTGCMGEILSYQDLRDSQKSGDEVAATEVGHELLPARAAKFVTRRVSLCSNRDHVYKQE